MKKTIAFFAFSLTAVSILLLSLAFHLIIKSESERTVEAHELLADHVFSELTENLYQPIIVSKMMAEDEYLQRFLKEEGDLESDAETMKKYLSRVKNRFGFYQTTLVSAGTHRYYRDDEVHKIINPANDQHDVWFSSFESSSRLFSINTYKHREGLDKSTMHVNYKIEDDDGKFLGIVGPSVYLKDMMDVISALESKYNVEISMTDSHGIVNLDSSFDEISVANLSYYTDGVTDRKYRRIGLDGFCITSYIEDFDWYIWIKSRSHALKSDKPHIFYLIAMIIFCVDTLSIFFAYRVFLRRKGLEIVSSDLQIDALTKLPNRNYFKDKLGEHGLFNTTAYKCMAVFDIDYFKEANDRLDGDELLRSVVATMNGLLNSDGVLYRWGGDEFLVLFEVPIENAYKICRAFCSEIENGKLITVSVGLTSINLFETIKTNYHRAARYCYTVKELGGNGVKKD